MRRLVWFLVAAAACRTADPPAGPGADASASAVDSALPPPMTDAAYR